MAGGSEIKEWSRRWDSNPRPTVYELGWYASGEVRGGSPRDPRVEHRLVRVRGGPQASNVVGVIQGVCWISRTTDRGYG